MAKTVTTTTTWACDRCRREVQSERRPNGPHDAWGYFKVVQDAGWDASGAPWCPRMREPLLLCGQCIEEVVLMINGFRIRFDGPPGPEAGRFVEVEDPTGRGIRAGVWREAGNGDWLLEFRSPPKSQEGSDA